MEPEREVRGSYLPYFVLTPSIFLRVFPRRMVSQVILTIIAEKEVIRAQRREAFEAVISPSDRGDMIKSYYELLTDADETISLGAAQAWSRWESSIAKLLPNAQMRANSDVNPRWAR